MRLALRSATPVDAGLILRLVRALAIYEKLEPEVRATEADIDEALTGQVKAIHCEIAELDWNTPSIGFSESLGTRLPAEWTGVRLTGEAMATLAASA